MVGTVECLLVKLMKSIASGNCPKLRKTMLLSAKKSDRKYTEGVVLATNMEALFRVVPPSLFLALGMTENTKSRTSAIFTMQHEVLN